MPTTIPGPLPGKQTLQTLKDRGATYEQRKVKCGKPNCSHCNGTRPGIPGHGPYWYLCVTVNAKWIRLYLGRDLDTSRFRDDAGQLNWDAIWSYRNRKKAAAVSNQGL